VVVRVLQILGDIPTQKVIHKGCAIYCLFNVQVVVAELTHLESVDASAQHQPVVPNAVVLVVADMPFTLQYRTRALLV